VQIEPDYSIHTFNSWITNKGRQFFDSIFGVWSPNKTKEDQSLETKDWSGLIKKIVKIMYIFEHCNQQKK